MNRARGIRFSRSPSRDAGNRRGTRDPIVLGAVRAGGAVARPQRYPVDQARRADRRAEDRETNVLWASGAAWTTKQPGAWRSGPPTGCSTSGIRSVGMDDIRDASGVSLKRLYRLFPAKEQLAEAALRQREAAFTTALGVSEAVADRRERLLAVFDHLRAWFEEPDFRGCPFVNAWGEAGAERGCVADAVADQKRALRAYLNQLVAAVDGLPGAVADQLFILANGAMVAAATLDWPEAASDARAAAATILDAHIA